MQVRLTQTSFFLIRSRVASRMASVMTADFSENILRSIIIVDTSALNTKAWPTRIRLAEDLPALTFLVLEMLKNRRPIFFEATQQHSGVVVGVAPIPVVMAKSSKQNS